MWSWLPGLVLLTLTLFRVATSISAATEHRRMPTVFLMGSQKGGSSSLYEILIRHPGLCGAVYKEPNYFLTNAAAGRDLSWYLSLFKDPKCLKSPGKNFVDGSCMLHGLEAALPVLNASYSSVQLQSLRFVVLLREPVARDFSWYKHRTRAHLSKGSNSTFAAIKTYGECFRSAEHNSSFHVPFAGRCHTRGNYAQQLKVFSRYFRREQILVLNSGLLFNNSATLMPAISEFLGVRPSSLWAPPFPRLDHVDASIKNPSCVLRWVPQLDCSTRDSLGAFYRGKNADLEKWLADTQAQAPRSEPLFTPFGDAFKSVPCVEDARAEYNKLKKRAKRLSCN